MGGLIFLGVRISHCKRATLMLKWQRASRNEWPVQFYRLNLPCAIPMAFNLPQWLVSMCARSIYLVRSEPRCFVHSLWKRNTLSHHSHPLSGLSVLRRRGRAPPSNADAAGVLTSYWLNIVLDHVPPKTSHKFLLNGRYSR